MDIELKDLLDFVTDAVDAGVQRYMRSRDPHGDLIKQAEARRYVTRLGYRPVILQHWVDSGLLTPVKTGEAQNAPVLYSLADIKTLVSSVRLKGITNRAGRDRP